jgi:hypothetical protein
MENEKDKDMEKDKEPILVAGSPEWYKKYPRGVGYRNADGEVIYMTHCQDLPDDSEGY